MPVQRYIQLIDKLWKIRLIMLKVAGAAADIQKKQTWMSISPRLRREAS